MLTFGKAFTKKELKVKNFHVLIRTLLYNQCVIEDRAVEGKMHKGAREEQTKIVLELARRLNKKDVSKETIETSIFDIF